MSERVSSTDTHIDSNTQVPYLRCVHRIILGLTSYLLHSVSTYPCNITAPANPSVPGRRLEGLSCAAMRVLYEVRSDALWNPFACLPCVSWLGAYGVQYLALLVYLTFEPEVVGVFLLYRHFYFFYPFNVLAAETKPKSPL